jgi:hypothetical protein
MFEAYGERMKPEEALAGVVKDGRQGQGHRYAGGPAARGLADGQ